MLRAVRCASPVHVLTANTGPIRSRNKVTAAEVAPSGSSPSRTGNMLASDKNQFSADHSDTIRTARGKKRMKAKPGRGGASGDTNPARTASPTSARAAAHVTATRRKFRPVRDQKAAD